MRITFVLGCAWRPLGGPRVVYEYVNHLAARGHQVTVVHARRMLNPPPAPDFYRWLRRKGAEARDLLLTSGILGRPQIRWQPIDPRVRMLFVPDLRARYVPEGDAVFATAWHTAESVAKYPEEKGKKFYLIQHYETWAGPKDRVDATWRAPMHKIVVARWLFQLGLELGCRDGEMSCIPNAVDHARFRVLRDIRSRPKRVAMLFSLHRWKGCEEGFQALENARRVHPDLEAVVFGTCWRRPSISAWAEYRRDPPQHELVERIYNSSRIFLCPSWYEGFSLVSAEAMACGCALVATDSRGNREFAHPSSNALLSTPRDVAALTRNLLLALEDDELRIRMAEAGVAEVQRFTWDRSTDLLEKVLSTHAHVGKA